MADDPTSTTADASAVPVPVAQAPQGAESVLEVAGASVEAVEATLVVAGNVERGEASSATAMEVDEANETVATSEEKEGEEKVESSSAKEGEETADRAVKVEDATEEEEGRSETATAEGDDQISKQVSAEDMDAGKGEAAAEWSELVPTGSIVHEDKAAERKQKEVGGDETPAVDAVGVADGTKEGENTQKPIDEKKSAAKPVDDTSSSGSAGAAKPEKEQTSEVSGKRKEREDDQMEPASGSNPEATEPTSKVGESSTKKQKVETPSETSVQSDRAAPAVVATAETVDAAAATITAAPIMISRDDMAKMEEDDGVLKFDVISNDGEPEHMVQLTTLKNIFAKQLPKMPKEYIVRLVFDRNHRSMIILKNGKHVIGGICYRPFEPNHFAEIAFCAINASDQVKGYGTRLMNHLKEYVKLKGISHFLTYADNYAIGYFKKQGFSKVVSMPRPNWFGYIKDYDGGTLMECTIHHQINYLRITSMVQKQRQAILDKIKQNSKAHIVYPGLMKFAEGRLLDIYMVPGVKEAGWSQATIRNNRIGTRDPGSLKTQLTQLWKAVSSHRSAWPFHEPVDTNVVVDYLDYIKEPIDLTTIGKRVEAGAYVTKAQFKADLDKMCTNCTVYNLPDTNYYKAAADLQEFINKRVQVRDQPR